MNFYQVPSNLPVDKTKTFAVAIATLFACANILWTSALRFGGISDNVAIDIVVLPMLNVIIPLVKS